MFLTCTDCRFCNSVISHSPEWSNAEDTPGLMKFYTELFPSTATFAIDYVIYEDICATDELIASTPVILHSSSPGRKTRCTLSINVTAAELLVVRPVHEAAGRVPDTCSYDDVIEMNVIGRVLCRGLECVRSNGVNVTSIDVIRVTLLPSSRCRFYWKVTGK